MRPVPVVFLRFAFSPQLSIKIKSVSKVVLDCYIASIVFQVVRLLEEIRSIHFLIVALGYAQLEQVFFWTCIERDPVTPFVSTSFK